MKFRKIVPVLLSMTFCLSSATYPALPAGAAAHNGSGTAGVNVTVTVEDADDDSTGGQMPDDDGTGDKIPDGGTGGQTPGSSGGDDAEPGQDDGGSKADTDTGKDDSNDGGNAGKDKDKNKDKDKGKDKDKNKDKDKGKDKGSGGTQNGEGDKGADDGNGESGKGTGGRSGKKNPSGRPAILPVPGYPAGGVLDAYPEPGRGLDDGAGDSAGDDGALGGASGSINEQEQADTGESGNADETGELGGDGDASDRDGDEPDGTGGSGSESNGFIKMALRYWKQAALAVLALAVGVLAVFFARRKIRFHGILADKDIDGVLFRGDTDSANGGAVIPELIGKLNEGGISFEEYEDMVMGSGDVTLLPTGTKMDISVTDDGLAKTWTAEKADERRMYDRLGEAALLAQMKGQTIKADVILKHDRKGIEIPLHFIFR